MVTCEFQQEPSREKGTRKVKNRGKLIKLSEEALKILKETTELTDFSSLNYKELTEKVLEIAEENKQEEKWKFRESHKYTWTSGTQEEIGKRKETCRAHRIILKRYKRGQATEEEVNKKWDEYQKQKKRAERAKTVEISALDKRKFEEITKDGMQSGKKFWKYVKGSREENKLKGLLDEEDSLIEDKEEMEEYLARWAREVCRSHTKTQIVSENAGGEQGEIQDISREEIMKVIKELKNGKAAGKDGITNEIIKNMSQNCVDRLRQLFNSILRGGEIPVSWYETNIKLIYKGKRKDNRKLESYRPIALSSNIYKMFTKILKNRLQGWMEGNNKFSIYQHGFRKSKKMEDCIYILLEAIQMHIESEKQLIITALDIEKAYDNIDRELLWKKMDEMGIPKIYITIITRLYQVNKCIYNYDLDGLRADGVISNIGLKQGCPLSSLLFLIYLIPLENKLQNSGLGLKIKTDQPGGYIQIPALLFADDILLLENSRENMEKLLRIIMEYGRENKLKFNVDKCTNIIYNNSENIKELRFSENREITTNTDLKYLGITINDSNRYLEKHEKEILVKMRRLQGIIKNKSMFSYNRLEVARILWKQVAVPALTFANGVIVLSQETRKALEHTQNMMGRFAMKGTKLIPNCAIQGEIGWSTFEKREAEAKIQYLGRLENLPTTELPKIIHNYQKFFSKRARNTKWYKRTNNLKIKYLANNQDWILFSKQKWWEAVKKEVKEKAQEIWRKEVGKKSSLVTYSSKRKYKKEDYLKNDLQSTLLCKARTGALENNKRLSKFRETTAGCDLCNNGEDETVTHTLLECTSFQNERGSIIVTREDWPKEELLRWMLGFEIKHKQHISDEESGKVKNLLLRWNELKALKTLNEQLPR